MSVFCLSWLLMMRGAICHFPSERLQLQSAAAAQAAPRVFICPGQCNTYVTAIDGLFTQAGGDSDRRVVLICFQIHSQTWSFRGATGCFSVCLFFVFPHCFQPLCAGSGTHQLGHVNTQEWNSSLKRNLCDLSVYLHCTDNVLQDSWRGPQASGCHPLDDPSIKKESG